MIIYRKSKISDFSKFDKKLKIIKHGKKIYRGFYT